MVSATATDAASVAARPVAHSLADPVVPAAEFQKRQTFIASLHSAGQGIEACTRSRAGIQKQPAVHRIPATRYFRAWRSSSYSRVRRLLRILDGGDVRWQRTW